MTSTRATKVSLSTTHLPSRGAALALLISAFLAALATKLLPSARLLFPEGLPFLGEGFDLLAEGLGIQGGKGRGELGGWSVGFCVWGGEWRQERASAAASDLSEVLCVAEVHAEVVDGHSRAGEVEFTGAVETTDAGDVHVLDVGGEVSAGRWENGGIGFSVDGDVAHDGLKLSFGVFFLNGAYGCGEPCGDGGLAIPFDVLLGLLESFLGDG